MRPANRASLLVLLGISLSCAHAPSAPSGAADVCPGPLGTSVILRPGETLRMTFTVPPASDANLLQTDVTFFPVPLSPSLPLSCQLFNGDILLATAGCVGNWQSAAVSAPLPNVPFIDFSSIAIGTAQGRVDFAVTGGSWHFDLKGNTVALARITPPPGAGAPILSQVATGTITGFALASAACN